MAEKPAINRSRPRWARINTIKSSLALELKTTFKEYRTGATISEVRNGPGSEKALVVDHTVPNLIALPPEADVMKSQAYRDGKLILQDKASCFPAWMLVGDPEDRAAVGDCIDGCAAPGNKTSHLAALLAQRETKQSTIYAYERDTGRSKTLQIMMERSGAEMVIVHKQCDFLDVEPDDDRHKNVTHLLLDPSCSGSGIIGREDIPSLALPIDPRSQKSQITPAPNASKKRKRHYAVQVSEPTLADSAIEPEETKEVAPDKVRLQKLSNLQTSIVEHALLFPAASRVTYSTCSIHVEENEAVAARVLASQVSQERGWRLLQREEQVAGLREWPHRGISKSNLGTTENAFDQPTLTRKDSEACIRCYPDGAEGTMGFFVCCFVRSPAEVVWPSNADSVDGTESWEGFAD